ncbi:hypothetical protein [Vibrio phage V-YDF132]|nr:hypothetical protein [Vibrio phage V-YDF132]
MAKTVEKMLIIDGIQFNYKAKVKPVLQEISITVRNSQGKVVASAEVMRHHHLSYQINKKRVTKGHKLLLEVAQSNQPKYYMTQIAMWLARKC